MQEDINQEVPQGISPKTKKIMLITALALGAGLILLLLKPKKKEEAKPGKRLQGNDKPITVNVINGHQEAKTKVKKPAKKKIEDIPDSGVDGNEEDDQSDESDDDSQDS